MTESTATRDDAPALEKFSIALWGACAGAFVTALVLLPLMQHLIQQSEAPENLTWLTGFYSRPPWQVGFQKWMYFAHCAVCPLMAWLLLTWRSRFNGWACLFASVASVPMMSKVYKGIFQGEPGLLDFVLAGAAIAIPLAPWNMLARLTGRWWSAAAEQAMGDGACQTKASAPASLPGVSARALAIGLAALAVLLLFFLLPRKVGAFADAFAGELHLASYFFGPALCMLDPNKVPALDFESHYGVGHAYLYSFFLGESYHQALCSYVWFMFAVLCFYFLSAYVVLANWLRSARAGFTLAVLLLVLSMECLSYHWPSCWPMRFPFLFLFLGSAARDTIGGRAWLPSLATGACAGLSFFWQTDIGVGFLAAGAVFYAALSLQERHGWLRTPLFLAGAGVTVIVLMLLAFGPRTLSLVFYRRLLDPMLEYSTGFGWHLMRWHFGWTYLYNLIGPLIALGTLGFCMVQFRSGGAEEKRNARFLFLASTTGLIMLFKWANRALDLAWTMNAAPLLIVLAWWIRGVVLALARRIEERNGTPLAWPRVGLAWSGAVGVACVLILIGVGWLAGRLQPPSGLSGYSDYPLGRLHRFTVETPTSANWLASRFTRVQTASAVASPVDPDDVGFLRRHTRMDEPVALLSPFDWAYLSEAHRPAAFYWVPVYYTHTHVNVERVEQNLKAARAVFVQRGTLDMLKTLQPSLYERLMPALEQDFVLAESGKNLDRYIRREGLDASAKRR